METSKIRAYHIHMFLTDCLRKNKRSKDADNKSWLCIKQATIFLILQI